LGLGRGKRREERGRREGNLAANGRLKADLGQAEKGREEEGRREEISPPTVALRQTSVKRRREGRRKGGEGISPPTVAKSRPRSS